MLSNTSTTSGHYLFMADEKGIRNVFPQLNRKLVENSVNHVTLIYFISDNKFVFQEQLLGLYNYFSTRFMLYIEEIDECESLGKEAVELVLTTNTRKELYFNLYGDSNLLNKAKKVLLRLGITKNINEESY